MRGVFNQLQLILFGDRSQRAEFHWMPSVVDGYDCLGIRCDCSFHGVRLQVERIWFDIDQNRRSSNVFDHIDGSSKCHWRRDHFVARANVQYL